jgi:hypothetical protein
VLVPIYMYMYCLLELNMLCDCVARGCGDHSPLTFNYRNLVSLASRVVSITSASRDRLMVLNRSRDAEARALGAPPADRRGDFGQNRPLALRPAGEPIYDLHLRFTNKAGHA